MKSDNELIAEFMGVSVNEDGKFLYPRRTMFAGSYNEWADTCEVSNDNVYNGYLEPCYALDLSNLCYHTRWDWLMPVVEKIESMNFYINGEGFSFDVIIRYDTCTVEDEDSTRKNFNIFQYSENNRKIEAVYKAVVEFIKWYNLQKNE